jgi:hypothetical protein
MHQVVFQLPLRPQFFFPLDLLFDKYWMRYPFDPLSYHQLRSCVKSLHSSHYDFQLSSHSQILLILLIPQIIKSYHLLILVNLSQQSNQKDSRYQHSILYFPIQFDI